MKRIYIFLCLAIVLGAILLASAIFGAAYPSLAQGAGDDDPGSSPAAQTDPFAPQEPAALLGRAYSGGPAYDSGWVSLEPDEARTLTHGLGGNPERYVVDMQYRSPDEDGINQRYYGGTDFGASPPAGHLENDRVGAYWRSLDDTSITVYRRPDDTYAPQVRVRIWIDPFPQYDSGWVALGANSISTLAHNLGGNTDDYVVDMQYRSAGSGVNQRYFGGADFGAAIDIGNPEDRVGAYWRSLDATNITVFRRAEDIYASEVRIRIWVRPRATYDSGWVSLSADSSLTLVHNLGGDVSDYQVDLQYRAADVNGVNQRYYGGVDFGALPAPGYSADDRVGAFWSGLNPYSINVYRQPEDGFAPQVRLRIFRYWTPTAPDYDSGWTSLATDAVVTLNHNLGGDRNDYLVDMLYRTPDTNGINQRYFGGSDFGDTITVGSPDDRVGAYWRSLTGSNITVYRRPEDTYAPEVRIRIWRMPAPDYDSGWVAKAPGEAASVLSHNLGGNYQGDYLVDFEYRNIGDGINQRYYGGADFGAKALGGGSENTRNGAYWRSLDDSTVTIYRRPDDVYAEELRLRIWRVAAPDYDSDWFTINPDQAQTLAHNLGGTPERYFSQVFQWDTVDNGLNQRHYGGADFGNLPPAGYAENDRVGSYWRSLDNASITVYRRPEDGFSDFMRVRIWDYTAYGVDLPTVMAMQGQPGETVTYTVLITNTSNSPSDTYALTLGTSDFTTTLSAAVVGPLDMGQVGTVDVAVDIPPGASTGDSDAVVLTATSTGDPLRIDSLTLITTVAEPPRLYLPLIER